MARVRANTAKPKRENKLTTCEIVQQFVLEYWEGLTLNEQAILEQVRQGTTSVDEWGKILIDHLKRAGFAVAEAYIVRHDKDMQDEWDAVEKRYIVTNKSNHFHMLLKFETGKGGTIDQIAAAIGTPSQYIAKLAKGRYAYDNKLAYLCHIKYPDKYQYDPNEIYTLAGEPYVDIYKRQYPTWIKAIGTIERKAAAQDIDDLEYKILQGQIERAQVFLTDDLFKIYSRYKRRCDDAFATYGEYKAYRTIEKLNRGEFKLTVFFIVGKAGSGKTNIVARQLITRIQGDAAKRGDNWQVYRTAATNTLDTYMGEEILLMDDVRSGAMRAEDWLKLLDPYTAGEQSARYHNKVTACRVVIITSTVEPFEFFNAYAQQNEAIDQFIRRIQSLVEVIRTDDGITDDLAKIKESIQLSIGQAGPTNGHSNWDFLNKQNYDCDSGINALANVVAKNNTINKKQEDNQ